MGLLLPREEWIPQRLYVGSEWCSLGALQCGPTRRQAPVTRPLLAREPWEREEVHLGRGTNWSLLGRGTE